MNAVIVWLTVRQLLGRRRTVLMLAFALMPLAVAIVVRAAADDVDPVEFTADALLGNLVIATLMPLIALVMGTAALGAEIDEGTAVYLLAKPIARWRIVVSKLVPAWLATAVIVGVSSAAAGAVAIEDGSDAGVVVGFTLASIAGALVYCAVFVWASVATSRALIGGLVYLFLWEGVITRLFTGTRVLSVRQYTLGLADLLTDTSREAFNARLDGVTALVLMVIVSTAAILLATRALERFEIGESA